MVEDVKITYIFQWLEQKHQIIRRYDVTYTFPWFDTHPIISMILKGLIPEGHHVIDFLGPDEDFILGGWMLWFSLYGALKFTGLEWKDGIQVHDCYSECICMYIYIIYILYIYIIYTYTHGSSVGACCCLLLKDRSTWTLILVIHVSNLCETSQGI